MEAIEIPAGLESGGWRDVAGVKSGGDRDG